MQSNTQEKKHEEGKPCKASGDPQKGNQNIWALALHSLIFDRLRPGCCCGVLFCCALAKIRLSFFRDPRSVFAILAQVLSHLGDCMHSCILESAFISKHLEICKFYWTGKNHTEFSYFGCCSFDWHYGFLHADAGYILHRWSIHSVSVYTAYSICLSVCFAGTRQKSKSMAKFNSKPHHADWCRFRWPNDLKRFA